jgi:DNA primase
MRSDAAASRQALCAAIIAGLIRWPSEIIRHAEPLASAAGLDPRFAALLDAAEHASMLGTVLESDGLSTILAGQGIGVPDSSDYTGLRFGFLSAEVAAETASAELRQAVGLLVERPALEAALVHATERLERELTDEAYAEQQRLLKRKLEFDSRLRQMSGALAATASAGGTGK